MEPWDGPAAVAFTDGRQIGATLDRNGLRPGRYFVTDDDLVVLASEMGVLDIPEEKIVQKWRLQPGKILLIDLEEGRIISDEELKESLSGAKPYRQWLDETQIRLDDLPPEVASMPPDAGTLRTRKRRSATPRRTSSSSSSRWRSRGRTRLVPWAATRRRQSSRTGRRCSPTTSRNGLPRSPTRRSIRSGRRQ